MTNSEHRRASADSRVPEFTPAVVTPDTARQSAASCHRMAAIRPCKAALRLEEMRREFIPTSRCTSVPLGAAAILVACLLVGAPGQAYAEPAAMSAEARAVFDQTKDKLLQLRVIHKATRVRASTGTGFVVTRGGLVLTNYHVVSKLTPEPQATGGRFDGPEIVHAMPDGRVLFRGQDIVGEL
jgi:S1-C subfamily serine protease